MKLPSFCAIAVVVFLSAAASFAEKPPLPTPVIPDGLGYNIHFTDARPGEMEMIADSGATIIRMDFSWSATEKEKGKYDFSAFDRLTASLEKHKIRPLYILDYSNKHYDEGLSPYSDEGRKAFARWAAAAAVHFKDRGILWEMYNEPNIGFWKPKPNPGDYIKLALEVGKALREAAPNELYIGPGTAQSPVLHTIDFPFLEQCFKAGLLEYWDAVSVHPYRQKGPETVLEEYARLRWLIDKYAPPNKTIPILSAEWGYSSVWHNFDDQLQGKMLPRQWMINLACDVPISIWYDWHDDGRDPKEPEHHFGTTNFEYKKDQNPVYDPKPSYLAAKTFNETFRGFRYNKRLWTGDDDVFVFLFDKNNGQSVKIAAWTMSKEPKTITIPSVSGKFEAVSHLGEKLPDAVADENGLKLTVSDGPIYLTPERSDDFWKAVSMITPVPLVSVDSLTDRISGKERIEHHKEIQGQLVSQVGISHSESPISISRPVLCDDSLVFLVSNPTGEEYGGINGCHVDTGTRYDKCLKLNIVEPVDNTVQTETIPIDLKRGETNSVIRVPLKRKPVDGIKLSIDLVYDPSGDGAYASTVLFPPFTMRLFTDFSNLNTESLNAGWSVVPNGDKNVGSEQKIEIEAGKLKLTFKYDEGWKFVRIFPKDETARKFDGKPKALAFQVRGDGTPVSINIRYRDSRGQTFQVPGVRLQDDSTQSLTFPLDGEKASHWGGPNDGVVHYPIVFDSIIVDGTRKPCGPGTVTFSSPVVIYEQPSFSRASLPPASTQ